MTTIRHDPDMPKVSAMGARDALEFLLNELNPEDSIDVLVAQEPYELRRGRRAYLMLSLREARNCLRRYPK